MDGRCWVLRHAGYRRVRGIRALIPADKVFHRSSGAGASSVRTVSARSAWEGGAVPLPLPEMFERYRYREQSAEPVFGQIEDCGAWANSYFAAGVGSSLWRLDCPVHSLLNLYEAEVRSRRSRPHLRWPVTEPGEGNGLWSGQSSLAWAGVMSTIRQSPPSVFRNRAKTYTGW